jgi:hypothetical protein
VRPNRITLELGTYGLAKPFAIHTPSNAYAGSPTLRACAGGPAHPLSARMGPAATLIHRLSCCDWDECGQFLRVESARIRCSAHAGRFPAAGRAGGRGVAVASGSAVSRGCRVATFPSEALAADTPDSEKTVLPALLANSGGPIRFSLPPTDSRASTPNGLTVRPPAELRIMEMRPWASPASPGVDDLDAFDVVVATKAVPRACS